MAVNPDFVGRTYPPSGPYAVDAALIAAFAAAVGSADAVHTDAEAARAAGYADVVAPPTMAVRFSQEAERAYIVDPEAGIAAGLIGALPVVIDIRADPAVIAQPEGVAMVLALDEPGAGCRHYPRPGQ